MKERIKASINNNNIWEFANKVNAILDSNNTLSEKIKAFESLLRDYENNEERHKILSKIIWDMKARCDNSYSINWHSVEMIKGMPNYNNKEEEPTIIINFKSGNVEKWTFKKISSYYEVHEKWVKDFKKANNILT